MPRDSSDSSGCQRACRRSAIVSARSRKKKRRPRASSQSPKEVSVSSSASPASPGPSKADVPHRLWGSRFAAATAAAMHALNRSIETDFRLWPYDIQLSKAWAVGLWNAGVLTLEESQRLESGLDAVA